MVDVGCGIGGSSRHIARKFGCESRGITLSPVQAARANEISRQQGFGDRLSFQVAGEWRGHAWVERAGGRLGGMGMGRWELRAQASMRGWRTGVPPRRRWLWCALHSMPAAAAAPADALDQPFPDGEFDLVWSMESGEHMPGERAAGAAMTASLAALPCCCPCGPPGRRRTGTAFKLRQGRGREHASCGARVRLLLLLLLLARRCSQAATGLLPCPLLQTSPGLLESWRGCAPPAAASLW